MFEYLSKFKVILVSGPHRAGTTITANMIAYDLGAKMFQEEDVVGLSVERFKRKGLPTPNDWNWFFLVQREAGYQQIVIQCPSHAHMLHHYAGNSDIAAVVMRRDLEDIYASQKRIGWGFEGIEKRKYPTGGKRRLAVLKYDQWDGTQKAILGDQAFEVSYNSIKDHPMYVPKEYRKNFTTRQIRIGDPRGQRTQGHKYE